jgi:hypothetical protein
MPVSPSVAVSWEGRKFMWDGQVYATAGDAAGAAAGYEAERFEVRLVEQDGTFLVYTRRAAGEATGTTP